MVSLTGGRAEFNMGNADFSDVSSSTMMFQGARIFANSSSIIGSVKNTENITSAVSMFANSNVEFALLFNNCNFPNLQYATSMFENCVR